KYLRARGVWEGRQRTRLAVRHFDVATGEPVAVGGDDSAPTPMELVLAALDGCLVVVVETVATELGIRLDAAEVASEASIDVRGFRGVPGVRPHFQHVTTTIRVTTPDVEQLAQAAVEVERRCPALNLVRDAGVRADVAWEVTS
ncbi:MAG: OsmC family protein, partial [Actinotalea sp.]|nr:OsmC family protein [Actinotalea sp.]